MSGSGVVGATLNTITLVFDVADRVKQGMRTDEELLRPSEGDVGGSAADNPIPLAENPCHLSAGAGQYRYQPLLSENHIRLLLLEPLAPSSTQDPQPIYTTLHHVEFDTESLSTRPYRALSYEWGAPPEKDEDSPIILLDGHPVRVRKNFHNALKSIRYLKGEICDSNIWLSVDALCINQSDVQERGHQVRLMKRIYQTAEMVLVWLGTGDRQTRAAMKVMHMEADDFEDLVFRKGLGHDELHGIPEICHMRYWRRAWILQEVVLARNYLVICNQDFVPMEKFERVLAVLDNDKYNWNPEFRKFYIHMLSQSPAEEIIKRRNSKGTTPPLVEWMRICVMWGFQATDPRDYVYALLGISDDCEGKIEPDYSRSAREVYSSAIALLVKNKSGGYGNLLGREFATLMGLHWDVGRQVWDEVCRRKFKVQHPNVGQLSTFIDVEYKNAERPRRDSVVSTCK